MRRAVTARLVGTDTDASLSSRLRERRWQRLLEVFPDIEEMRVLDLGGEAEFWRRRREHPAHVTMVNLFPQHHREPWLESIAADACELPGDLGRFDLAFSNSVIEHVGAHDRRERFAEQVRRSAPRYWVQTPNRWFPIEPHFVFPFFQHLPTTAQAHVARWWPLGNFAAVKDVDVARRAALGIELVSKADMRGYFPDAEILVERFAGLPKSFVAVRR